MLTLNPASADDIALTLHIAVKKSGLTLREICKELDSRYEVKITASGLPHSINHGTIRLQRALQILAICGVSEITIRPVKV